MYSHCAIATDHKHIKQFFSPFALCQYQQWVQTNHLCIVCQVFYHFVTAIGHTNTNKSFFTSRSHPMPATRCELIIFGLWVKSYGTVLPLLTIHTLKKVFCTIFNSLLPAAGFEPITFGYRGECTATVLPLLNINILEKVFHHWLTASTSNGAHTNHLCIMSQALYHCITIQTQKIVFSPIAFTQCQQLGLSQSSLDYE